MTSNTIKYLDHLANKAHLERADLVSLQQYEETVANNLRNFKINKMKNSIQKLANDQLNNREIAKLEETIRHDVVTELEANRYHIAEEEIARAKNEIEKAHNAALLEMNKDTNSTDTKGALINSIGRVLSFAAGASVKAGLNSVGKGEESSSLDALAASLEPKQSSGGVKGFFNNLADVAKGAIPAISAVGIPLAIGIGSAKLFDAAVNKGFIKLPQIKWSNRSNPSEATRLRDDNEIPSDEGHRTLLEAKETLEKESTQKGGKSETIGSSKKSNEVFRYGSQNAKDPSSGEGIGNIPESESSRSNTSNVIYSPGVSERKSREYGPGIGY